MKTIDLFSGIGGIRLGFEQAGIELEIPIKNIFSSEIDKHAIEIYKKNFGEEDIAGDITQVNEKNIPKFDILMAGFPCQPFSQAGLKKGLKDERGQLFYDIIRILDYHKPKAFLLENVKQLKGHNQGKTLKIMSERLSKLGYVVYTDVLKAKDFGVPQNRERLFIVGFKDKNITFKFPEPLNIPTQVSMILDKNIPEKYIISDRLWAGHKRRKEENKKNGKGFGYSLVNKDSSYTNTISARYYKDGSEILIEQEGRNPRKLTPKEASRLQGFPDSFQISTSDVQAYKQFGNSVTVPVVKAVAKEILLALKS